VISQSPLGRLIPGAVRRAASRRSPSAPLGEPQNFVKTPSLVEQAKHTLEDFQHRSTSA